MTVPTPPVAPERDRHVAVLAALGAAVLWGTTGAAQELGVPDAAPATVAAARNALGGLGLLGVVVLTGRAHRLRSVMAASPVAAIGAAGAMAVFALGYLTAVRQVGVGLGTLLTIGGAPVFAGAFGALLGRRPGARWTVATVTTVTGAGVLLLPGTSVGAGAGSVPAGLVSGVVAGAAYAAYATVSKRLLEAGADPVTTMALTFACSGLLLMPVLALGDLAWLGGAAGMLTIVWLGLGSIVVGYLCFARALRSLDAPTITTFTLAEPLTAAVLGIVLLGERPTLAAATGGGLVACGLVVVGSARPVLTRSWSHRRTRS